MKTAWILMAAVLIFGFSCGVAMQTASPSPSPSASPSPSPSPSPGKVPQKIRVSQGVSDGLLIHRVEPVLPNEPHVRIKADVVLMVIVDRQGNVDTVKLIKGHPLLVSAAIDAVRQWKYKPFLLNGEPLEVETTVTLHFKK